MGKIVLILFALAVVFLSFFGLGADVPETRSQTDLNASIPEHLNDEWFPLGDGEIQMSSLTKNETFVPDGEPAITTKQPTDSTVQQTTQKNGETQENTTAQEQSTVAVENIPVSTGENLKAPGDSIVKEYLTIGSYIEFNESYTENTYFYKDDPQNAVRVIKVERSLGPYNCMLMLLEDRRVLSIELKEWCYIEAVEEVAQNIIDIVGFYDGIFIIGDYMKITAKLPDWIRAYDKNDTYNTPSLKDIVYPKGIQFAYQYTLIRYAENELMLLRDLGDNKFSVDKICNNAEAILTHDKYGVIVLGTNFIDTADFKYDWCLRLDSRNLLGSEGVKRVCTRQDYHDYGMWYFVTYENRNAFSVCISSKGVIEDFRYLGFGFKDMYEDGDGIVGVMDEKNYFFEDWRFYPFIACEYQ